METEGKCAGKEKKNPLQNEKQKKQTNPKERKRGCSPAVKKLEK